MTPPRPPLTPPKEGNYSPPSGRRLLIRLTRMRILIPSLWGVFLFPSFGGVRGGLEGVKGGFSV
ncbi:MAG: hypothetical protein LBC74_12015 [Planctomycetaceae bacterium]|nr:hypothetical protein [Planctomycetaceae bacterium]